MKGYKEANSIRTVQDLLDSKVIKKIRSLSYFTGMDIFFSTPPYQISMDA